MKAKRSKKREHSRWLALLYMLAVSTLLFLSGSIAFADPVVTADGLKAVDYNGHAYKITPYNGTWEEIEAKCREMGGYLAAITSADENEFVGKTMGGIHWLGARREEDTWRWVNGEPWGYSNWSNGQPDNYDNSESCLEINRFGTGQWNDIPEGWSYSGICEWDEQININTLSSDSFTWTKKKVYNGVGQNADLTICYDGDKTLPLTEGWDYTVSYSNNVSIGKATFTITGKGRFCGSVKKTFYITNDIASFASLKSDTKPGQATLTINPVNKANRYDISYYVGTNKKKAATKTVTKTKVTLKNLDEGKQYHFRVRAYRNGADKNTYGAWSEWRDLTSLADAFVKVKNKWYYRGGSFHKKEYDLKGLPLVIEQSLTIPAGITVKNTGNVTTKDGASLSLENGTAGKKVKKIAVLECNGNLSVTGSQCRLGMNAKLTVKKDASFKDLLALGKQASVAIGGKAVIAYLTLDDSSKLQCEKNVTINGYVDLGKKSILDCSKNLTMQKYAYWRSFASEAKVNVGETFTYNTNSGWSHISRPSCGTVTVGKNANIKSKSSYISSGTHTIAFSGTDKHIINVSEGNVVGVLSLEKLALENFTFKGKGSMDTIKFDVKSEMNSKRDELSGLLTVNPASGKGRNKNCDNAILDVLYLILVSRSYNSKDLLVDFYDSMAGIATFTEKTFSVPYMMRTKKGTEKVTVSGSFTGWGKHIMGMVTVSGSSVGNYSAVIAPNVKATTDTVKKFMSGVKKGAKDEIQSEINDILLSEFMASLKSISDAFDWNGGAVICEFYNQVETFDEYGKMLTRYINMKKQKLK